MGRPGITYEEVAQTAELLAKKGINPTITQVRDKLGTGSRSTIHQHLTEWRKTIPSKTAVNKPVLPLKIQSALMAEIEFRVDEARAELQEEMERLRSEAETLAEDGKELEAEMDALRERNETLETQCQRLQVLADERSRELEACREAAEKAILYGAQIESLREQLQDCKQREKELRADYKALAQSKKK